MNQFETHVYAIVRVKVIGTNFSKNPQEIAEKVSGAVCARPSNWMKPIHGSIDVAGHGAFDIEAVEFADGIESVLVDEIDQETGRVMKEHEFNEKCEPRSEAVDIRGALTEVISVLETHPEAERGNAKVHFALMKLKGLIRQPRISIASAEEKNFLVSIGADYQPEDGDQMDGLMSALEHFEIPASVVEVK